MNTRLRRSGSHERGSMAVEVVILAPILVLVLLLVVAFGRYVDRKADVEAMARDAARAATFERTEGAAANVADGVVQAAAGNLYDGAQCRSELTGPFAAGGTINVTVVCELPWDGLAPIGLNGTVGIEAQAQAPLDQWRRTG